MARDEIPVSQSSANQTPSGPPPQGYPVPQGDQIPPQGYPNHHDNPLSPPTPTKHDAYNVPADINMHTNNQQSTRSYVPDDQQPPPPPPQAYTPETYPPQQAPTAFPPQEQPTAFPPQEQPTAFPPQPPPFTNGASFNHQTYANSTPNHQTYANSTPNHNAPQYYVPQQVPMPITGTPTAGIYQQPAIQGWSTGLLECFDDPENAVLTFLFPCVTFGQIAEIADNGQSSCGTSGLIYALVLGCIGMPCIMSCSYRSKIRARFNLLETPAPDWVTHFFCEYCALCQEYRELKNRGLDPAIGWQGNLLKHQQVANYAAMTPPMNQRMM